jgi:hypothetical protein
MTEMRTKQKELTGIEGTFKLFSTLFVLGPETVVTLQKLCVQVPTSRFGDALINFADKMHKDYKVRHPISSG